MGRDMLLARRNLLKDKTRMAISTAGVALAVMLIVLLNGLLDGMYRQITSYLDRSPASIVVAQEDVTNLLGANSLLPAGALSRTEAIRGVDQVIPILSQFVILDLHKKKQPAFLVGYEPDRGGGPWELAAGREPRKKTEIVFDRVLANRHGLRLGDSVEVLGRDFIIVGLSNGTTSWMTSFIFLQKQAAENLLLLPGASSYLLVTISDHADITEIVSRANRQSGVTALTKQEMAANDLRLFAKVFSAPLRLMIGIAFLVGTLIVGFVTYTITVERQREYGVLRALGAPNGVLYRLVLIQALTAALIGSAAGILLAHAVGQWIMRAKPQFMIFLDPAKGAWTLAAGLGMALVSALFPLRLIASLAPAQVFRK